MSSTTQPGGPLRILRNPNYLKYFVGQVISMSGTWMQSVAQSWLVYDLTHSGFWLGVITFASQLPAFLMSPLAGVLADHSDRRRVLIIVQLIEMAQALTLAALFFSGKIHVWHIVALAMLNGIVGAFDMTTRHAFAIDMVGRSDLASAIALNSVLINLTRVIGPSIASILLAAFGVGWCFLLNGLSYIPVVIGLALMTVKQSPHKPAEHGVLRDILDGLVYMRKSPLIFRILILSTLTCLLACPFMTLLPVFAKNVLSGDPGTLGLLTSAMGLGAVTAALLYSAARDLAEIKRRLIGDVIFWGLGLITLGLSHNLWLSLGAMFTIGYFMMSLFPTMNHTIQDTVDDSMRGRVMSLYTMTFLGTVPFGSLLMGWLSDRYTAPHVVTGAGAITLLMGFTLAVRSALRSRLREIAAAFEARI